MLGRFSNLLNQAVEALAPSQSNLDDFEFHWRATTGYFLENRDAKAPLKSTAIPGHLDSMLDILCEEESRFFESHSASATGGKSSSSSSSNARPTLLTSPSVAATGPCMEFLLQNNILETLFSLGNADCPPGMRHKVLDFFTKLLSRVRQPILPHVHVYKPVHRLVESCGRVRAGPNELEEILFLCTLAAKLKQDSYLVNFFLEAPEDEFPTAAATSRRKTAASKKPKNLSEGSSSSPAVDDSTTSVDDVVSSVTSVVTPVTSTLAVPEDLVDSDDSPSTSDFALVASLLSLSESPDAQVSIKACEGLLLVASLPEADAARILVDRTAFSSALTTRLVKAYRGLPTELTASQLEPLTNDAAETHWGLRWGSGGDDGGGGGGGVGGDSNPAVKRRLNSFLSLFDYVDQLMVEAHPTVSEALAAKIKTDFLEDVFEAHLLSGGTESSTTASSSSSAAEDRPRYRHPVLATVLVTRLLSMIRSPSLLKAFVHFLLGDDEDAAPETFVEDGLDDDDDDVVPFDGHPVRRRLIARCGRREAADETLALVSLRLFHSLLTKPEESIYQNLLLRNLVGRSYADRDFVRADERRRRGDPLSPLHHHHHSMSSDDAGSGVAADGAASRRDPPNGIDKDLASFLDGLDLVPFGVMEGEEEAETTSTPIDDSPMDDSPMEAAALAEWSPQDAVVWFLHLIPESARSSSDGVENGYEIYLMDAHHLLSSSLKTFAAWNWPSKPVSFGGADALSSTSSSSSSSFRPFFEGSFLRMLLSLMERILSGRQSYDVNLQVTALVSVVAAVPHPNLDEFWTNPQLPLRRRESPAEPSTIAPTVAASVKTPATVLKALIKELEDGVDAKFASVDEFRRAVAEKKEEMTNPAAAAANDRPKSRGEDEAFLEGAILLEEFCKELSSLVLVKDQLLSAKNT